MTRRQTDDRGEVVMYRTEDGRTALDVRLEAETVWLTQAQMVQLFQRDQSVISRHINTVFKEKELDPKSNMQKMHSAKSDKPVLFYSLDTIISVGYRVNSKRAVAQIGADAGWKLARPIRHGMKRRLGERTAATGWAT